MENIHTNESIISNDIDLEHNPNNDMRRENVAGSIEVSQCVQEIKNDNNGDQTEKVNSLFYLTTISSDLSVVNKVTDYCYYYCFKNAYCKF